MKKRMSWNRQEVTYVGRYWVIGERLLLKDGEDGWYVSSWSDPVHITGYWVAQGKFYQASINWVTGRTADLEIIRQIELDPERERITRDAIDQWTKHPEDRTFEHATEDEPALHLAAA
jgi:hypothetical protein